MLRQSVVQRNLRQLRPVVQSLTVDAALRRWSRRVLPVAWTTATQYCTVSLTIYYNGCSPSRMPLRACEAGHSHRSICEHITSILRELHWLPVRRRVEFKMATLVFKALNGFAPPYLVDDCNLVSDDIRRLRSAVSFTCALPRTWTRLGDRSFAVAGPRVWNCLLAALRAVEDLRTVQKAPKTHLFD